MKRYAKGAAARDVLAGIFICVSLCFATLVLAQAETKQYDIDIATLPLTQALQEFSAQTQLQHGYLPTDGAEENILAGPINGRYTVAEALAALLPVGFTFEWIDERTVRVVSPPGRAPPGGVLEEASATDQQRSALLLEQQLSMAFGGERSGSARSPYHWDERITVEASRIWDSLDLDVPTMVIDRQQIEASGASTVTDLLKYITQQPFTMSEHYLGDGTQFADLRGLGFDTTLVLINGRRTIATASSLTVNAFDLNSIPLTAVERIEIVSDSTSAMHGADAIGGVFNIVLRESIPRPRLDIDYGAAAGGGVDRRAAFSATGHSEHARGSIVLDYFDRSPLLGRERDRWNNQDFRRFGSIDWRSSSAAPGNVSSETGDNLPGLPSSFAAIPFGSMGIGLTPSDFLATAGQRNLESLYKYHSVIFQATHTSAMAQGEYLLVPGTSIFGELLYVDRSRSVESEPSELTGALVPASNPFNAFRQPVLVDVLLADLGPKVFKHSAKMVRAATGLRGQVRAWDWELSLLKNQDKDVSLRTNDLDPTRVTAALAAADPKEALNVFGGSSANSPQLLASLLTEPAKNHYLTEARQALAYLRGELFSVPAGHVEAILGGEWRDERVSYEFGAPTNISGSHQRSISAAFAELRLPLVAAAAKVPAMHELSLVLSGRFDRYSDIGDSFNPQYALIWRPTSALTLRSSFAKSFRPPPLFDLHFSRIEMVGPVADPHRNNELAFPIWRAGGNSDLDPSNAESFTTTLAVAPVRLPTLRIAANYWQIKIDETIGVMQPQRLLAAEDQLADRVIRAEPSAADIAAGLPGPLLLMDLKRMNFGLLRTSGVDGSASFGFDTRMGQFTPNVSATWVREFVTSDRFGGPEVTRVSVANLGGSVARWRAVAGMAWNHQGLELSATARYIPSYDDVDTLGHRNGRTVRSQTLVDAQLSFDLQDIISEHSPWSGFEIRIGVFNLFNEEPPFAEVGWFSGYDSSQGDLKQRFAYLKLSKKFLK